MVKVYDIKSVSEGYHTAPDGMIQLVFNMNEFIENMDATYGQ